VITKCGWCGRVWQCSFALTRADGEAIRLCHRCCRAIEDITRPLKIHTDPMDNDSRNRLIRYRRRGVGWR
jgi:hypothetical protein